ncbi:DUF3944 domain-containing protein [Acinetobacter sp. RIT698]|uniref:DUF3944 domain-containing protein n=1 Tax=Acinetobacter sp. RIT698 TaxID=2666192 RepID=UPI0012AD157A|nr:DUF3944 domain-containing protein [Acinetobacter sp. RIT698]MRT38731.1 DUF3944 domain-containing protein [Acinetobacter sp. RIT698]
MATEAKFREDPDLAFLQYCDSQDLKLLANTLIADSEGTEQWTGGLKSTLVKNIRLYPTEDDLYKNSWKAIAAEIQLFGGDTLVNFVRGNGIVYREILEDVANQTGVDFHKATVDINLLEEKLLRTLFGRITQLNDLGFIYKTLKEKGYLGLTSIKESPLKTIKNSVGGGSGATGGLLAGLNVAKNFIKVNPLLAAVTLPLTAKDITAPAYRVTIPACCIVAMMRVKHEKNKNDHNEF